MNFSDLVEKRRSVKKYNRDHEFTDEEIKKLMELTIQSPTAFNIQNWRFLIVRDKELREKMEEASWYQKQVTESSMMVVVCGDKLAWKEDTERYYKNAPDKVRDSMVKAIISYYDGNEEAQRDEVFRSGGMAAMTLMFAAKDMGYDTCPMTGFDFDKMKEIISLPDDYEIVMMVAVGKRSEDPRPRPGQLKLGEVIAYERF